MTPQERRQRIREIAAHVAERLTDRWPEGVLDVHEIEELAEQVGRDVQREISERFLREEAARQEGDRLACPCGAQAHYQQHYALLIVSAAGRFRVWRAYYYCRRCGKGHCPADLRLGLGVANTTPLAQAREAVLSALEPYVQVNDLLAQLGVPLELDVKSTERVTQAVGTRVAAAMLRPFGPAQRPVAVGFDGVMIPTWEGGREVRCGVVYEPDEVAGRTPGGEASLRKEYFATTGSRESLVGEVCARARERAAGAVVAVVCDGAALDWVELDRHLPNRVEILDFYHVLARVAEIAQAMHPEDAPAAAAWRNTMKQELLEIGPWALLRALEAWEPEDAPAQEVRRVQRGYLTRQEERMRYPDYRRQGFPIGSGAVEGACKHVVVDRFDRSGMRWKLETAEPVLRLRAALLTQPRLDLRPFAGSKTVPVLA